MNKVNKIILGISIGCTLLSIGPIVALGIVNLHPEKAGFLVNANMQTFLND